MNFMIANCRNFAPRLTPTPTQPTNHHYHCIWSNCRDADIKRHRCWNYNLSTEPDHEVGTSTTTLIKTAIADKMVVCMHVDISRDTFHVSIWRMNNVPNRYNILHKTASSWTCVKKNTSVLNIITQSQSDNHLLISYSATSCRILLVLAAWK